MWVNLRIKDNKMSDFLLALGVVYTIFELEICVLFKYVVRGL